MNMSSRVRHSLPRASSQGRLFFEHLSLPMQTTVESQFKNFFKVGLIPNTFHVGRNTLFDPLQPVRGDVVVYSYVPDAVIVHLFCQGRLTFGVICIASPTMTVAGLVHRMRVAYGGTYHVRDGIDGDRLIRDFVRTPQEVILSTTYSLLVWKGHLFGLEPSGRILQSTSSH